MPGICIDITLHNTNFVERTCFVTGLSKLKAGKQNQCFNVFLQARYAHVTTGLTQISHKF